MTTTESQPLPGNDLGTDNSADCAPDEDSLPITGDDVHERNETANHLVHGDSSPNPETEVNRVFKQRKIPKPLDVRLLDLRVGQVNEVTELEDEDGTFVLSIDIKRPALRIALSSLLSTTGFDMYDLIDTKVVTVLNAPVTLSPDDVECNIRVLAAVRMGGEDNKEVKEMEVLRPPKKAKVGKQIYAEGYFQEQYWAIKEKVYNKIMKDLMVDNENRAVYRGSPLQVKGRFVTTETMRDCSITNI